MLKTAEYWIKKLQLTVHPEGGYFRESYRSAEIISKNSLSGNFMGDRNFSTAIYYLLQGDNISTWHKIKSDEMWHYYDGSSAINIHVLSKNKGHEILKLGRNLDHKENLQAVVPANTWFAARLEKPNSFALAGCTVSPGFNFADFQMADEVELIKNFADYKEIIRSFYPILNQF